MSLFRGENPVLGSTVVDTGASLAVTSADALTVGGTIVPQTEPLIFSVPAATQAVNQAIFVAETTYQVAGLKAVWGTASSSGTVTIEKLTGTTAPGSGTALLTGTISTAGTANTVTTGTLIATLASLKLAAGDRLGVVFSGTETGLVGLVLNVTLKRI